MPRETANVLVLAVGSPLGQSVAKALMGSKHVEKLFVSDVYEDAPGRHFKGVVPVSLPFVSDPTYTSSLDRILAEHSIDVVFPIIRDEEEYFERHISKFEGKGVRVIHCKKSVRDVCNDKYRCVQVLSARGFETPRTVLPENDSELRDFLQTSHFPVVLKPRSGVSSKDLFFPNSGNQLGALLGAFPRGHFICQEFLSDPRDYTAGVYCNKDLTFVDSFVIERELKFGLSYKGRIIDSEPLSEACRKIAVALEADYSINLQFKLRDEKPVVYEINPRLSSTTCVRAHFGFNEPELAVKESLGLKLGHSTNPLKKGSFARFWEEHYESTNL